MVTHETIQPLLEAVRDAANVCRRIQAEEVAAAGRLPTRSPLSTSVTMRDGLN